MNYERFQAFLQQVAAVFQFRSQRGGRLNQRNCTRFVCLGHDDILFVPVVVDKVNKIF